MAPVDISVLILGETGTGKELVARAIHNASRRRDRPLVKVNCATLPAALVESELFDHEKGAFSGAHARQVGRFEIEDGGTVFLDEIGELPLELQPKLLRVPQEAFERLGNHRTLSTNVRVLAATNRDLKKEVHKGRFRDDLYYRLNAFPITVPPLRDRREDIPLLAPWFAGQFNKKLRKGVTSIPKRDENARRLSLAR
ncbi:MAG TPA: sigma 54-interacting transcriptional regulator [Vicinamibacteria bacterium]|nr:sigma 54-interacting transcriptional regulator [Vicinamibacteria bacterium]